MTEAKHTPGPWRYSEPFEEFGAVWAGDVKVLDSSCNNLPCDEQRKNGQVAAAAFDMLVALNEGAQCLEDVASGKGGWAWEEVLDGMRAAIAKATGA